MRTIGVHGGPKKFEAGEKQMVSTRNMTNEKISDVEQMVLLMSLLREMAKMKRKN